MKDKWTLPKLRDKCKELGYDYTQEGTDYYVNTSKCHYKFHRKEQLLNWFKYHIWFDVL